MSSSTPNDEAIRILVVDDVEANRSVICRHLEGRGYELQSVESGEEALQLIREEWPSLVLLDYMMPNMNGIEMLQIVRREWAITDLPIIMLTARNEPEAQVTALEAGADDYVTKPIDFDVLKARIERQLNQVEASDKLRQANAALDERVSIRGLAFDELRLELEREILARKAAERELMNWRSRPQGPVAPENVLKACEMIDSIARGAALGKPANNALLLALKQLVLTFSPPPKTTSQTWRR